MTVRIVSFHFCDEISNTYVVIIGAWYLAEIDYPPGMCSNQIMKVMVYEGLSYSCGVNIDHHVSGRSIQRVIDCVSVSMEVYYFKACCILKSFSYVLSRNWYQSILCLRINWTV